MSRFNDYIRESTGLATKTSNGEYVRAVSTLNEHVQVPFLFLKPQVLIDLPYCFRTFSRCMGISTAGSWPSAHFTPPAPKWLLLCAHLPSRWTGLDLSTKLSTSLLPPTKILAAFRSSWSMSPYRTYISDVDFSSKRCTRSA